MIPHMGISVSDDSFLTLLAWAKSHDFPVDVKTAFNPQTWDILGDCLWDEVIRGDTTALRLVATWGVLSRAIRGQTPGESKEEMGTSESEDVVSGGTDTPGAREAGRAAAGSSS